MTPDIMTARLLLRAVKRSDAADIYAYVRNPNVLRYTTGTPPQSLAETEAFVATLVGKPDGAHAWAIRLRDEPAVIGLIEFGIGDGVTGSVDYALAEEHWNRGLMTEAVRAVLDWGFRAYPTLARVESAAMKTNPASIRVQQKCGMRFERTETHTWEKSSEPVEVAIHTLTRDEWIRNSTPQPVAPPAGLAQRLITGRHIASLATMRPDGSIHLAAIWFLYRDGMLYFPTSSRSRKARNVAVNPTATAMIDTRVPGQEQGVSVTGHAKIIDGPAGRALVAEAQARYLTPTALADPAVGPRYAEFDDVVIALTPIRWVTWNIAQMNAEQFDGKLGIETGYLHPLD